MEMTRRQFALFYRSGQQHGFFLIRSHAFPHWVFLAA